MTSPVTIRLATSADAAVLATIHVHSWQWAYQGQVPDAYLEHLGQTLTQRIEVRRIITTATLARQCVMKPR